MVRCLKVKLFHTSHSCSPSAYFLEKEFKRINGRAKRAPHWGVQSRFRVIYIYLCMYVCRVQKCVGGIMWPKHAHAQSQFWAVKTDL